MRFLEEITDQDYRYMVANRSVGTGLTASAVISSWLYSTALLGAPYLTYWYGIALPVWWANGQSIMICMFGWLAIQAKLKVPNAHTLLELIQVRYGTVAHILWIVLCTINNLFIFSSMLVGASAAVSALTGMNIVAATYLLPLGVVIYTYFGGIRATFLTDYIHTFIIMIILVWFTIKIFTIKEINSIGALYETLMTLSKKNPVKGNHDGSYLTMTSKESIYFGIIHILYVATRDLEIFRSWIFLGQILESSSLIQVSGKRCVDLVRDLFEASCLTSVLGFRRRGLGCCAGIHLGWKRLLRNSIRIWDRYGPRGLGC